MKKLIALLMVICIMACGCGKEETKNTTTPAPTAETKASDDMEKLEEEIDEQVKASRVKLDLETYDAMIAALQLGLTDKKAYAAMKDVEEAYIDITPDGVKLTNIDDALLDAILMFNPDFMDNTMHDDYRIKISKMTITREKAPQP